jgi:hypothetical protein
MAPIRVIILAACVLLALGACCDASGNRKLQEEPLNGGLPIDVRVAVEEAWAVAKSAVASGDHELFSSLFAPNARLNIPNHHPITGAVGEAWDKLLSFFFKGTSAFSGNITTSDAIYLKNKHASGSNGKEYFVLTRNAYNLSTTDSNELGDTGASIALFQWLPMAPFLGSQIAAALGFADPPKLGSLKFRWFASNSDQDEEGSVYASLDDLFEGEDDDDELDDSEVDAMFGEADILRDPPLSVRLERTVNATWNRFHKSILAKDITGVKRTFSDDVHLYPPFTKSISGLGSELEKALEKLFDTTKTLTPPTRTYNELILLKGKVKRHVGGVKTKVKHFILEESDFEHEDGSSNGWFTTKGKQMCFWELQKPKSAPAFTSMGGDDLSLGGSVLKKDVLKLGWAMWNGNHASKHHAPAPAPEPTEAPAPPPTEAPSPKEAEIQIVDPSATLVIG